MKSWNKLIQDILYVWHCQTAAKQKRETVHYKVMQMRTYSGLWLLCFIDLSQLTTSNEYTALYGNADLQEAVSIIM